MSRCEQKPSLAESHKQNRSVNRCFDRNALQFLVVRICIVKNRLATEITFRFYSCLYLSYAYSIACNNDSL